MHQQTSAITLSAILSKHRYKVGVTWLMVILENVLLALLPLFIGYSIDSLLVGQHHDLITLSVILTSLIVLSVLRRIYDTRAYGEIRVEIGMQADSLLRRQSITTRNARLTMSREIVDFLEDDLPPLLTAIIQLFVAIVILWSFNFWLGLGAILTGLMMLLTYSGFHQSFIRLNAKLNTQMERQVNVLSCLPLSGLRVHLNKLKCREIHLSDTEAIVYGLIFLLLFGFVVINLLLTTQLLTPSSGELFSIVTYSLEFVEAAIMLPITLQTLSRLSEINQRLNVT
ncbi:ABC transporter six-transmembrane domain-containing protein [Vibrio tapetis subsp. quintayensis]|uniref:ABC transporter six-transmembrane domain-containing protein n=1 Tax=Vibrio tapetis TaxID=52443 RepID=UPI0025B4F377|nr:ABC transporter six-transmembrane domain-containing protein [Vibrio tapetis]MDN3680848.1 ABC transporter six-transmembrane domain-containing protein [Vibrio tapetis subsp. quintayensis]